MDQNLEKQQQQQQQQQKGYCPLRSNESLKTNFQKQTCESRRFEMQVVCPNRDFAFRIQLELARSGSADIWGSSH